MIEGIHTYVIRPSWALDADPAWALFQGVWGTRRPSGNEADYYYYVLCMYYVLRTTYHVLVLLHTTST